MYHNETTYPVKTPTRFRGSETKMILLAMEKIDEQYLGIWTTNRSANGESVPEHTHTPCTFHTPKAYHYGRLEFILWDNLKSSS